MNELTTTFRVESPPAWLEIGYDAENNWRTITINCEYWFNINANGTVVLMYKPACSKPAYPLKTVRSGNNIVWTPESAELIAGVGTMQAFYEVDGTTIGASKKIPCEVDGSLLGSASGGTPPWAIEVLEEIKTLTGHYPYVSDNTLYVWDSVTEQWVEFSSTGGGAVDSVNGQTGVVVLGASDVGALPDSYTPPVVSVNGKTGAVALTASDVDALPDSTVIPPEVTEQTVSGWGFTKNTGTYSKPSTGIPKADLASDVQTSLGKADTALQQHQSLSGYATETWVNQQGFLKQHQDISGKADKVLRVAMTASDTTPTLDPNKLYVFPEMASLTPTLNTPSDATIVNEYHFIFDSGATATVLTLPATILQPDGFTVEANMHYEISILEGAMTAQGWAVAE